LQLREDVRQAKEALSTTESVSVPVAAGGDDVLDVRVARRDFEALIGADLGRTVGVLEKSARDAGVTREAITAVYLTGGSSRVPLVGALAGRFHPRTYTRPDPKTLVVRGAIAARRAMQAAGEVTAPPEAAPAAARPAVPGAPATAGPAVTDAPAASRPAVPDAAPSRPSPAPHPSGHAARAAPSSARPATTPPTRGAGEGWRELLIRDRRPTAIGIGAAIAVLAIAVVGLSALLGSGGPSLEITASGYAQGSGNVARLAGTVDPADATLRVGDRRARVRDGRWSARVRVPRSERVKVTASGGGEQTTETIEIDAPRLGGDWSVIQRDVFASAALGGPVGRARAGWRFRPVCREDRCDAAVLAFPSPGGVTEIRLRRRGRTYRGRRSYSLPRSGICAGQPYRSRWTTAMELTVTGVSPGDASKATRFRGLARHRSRPPASVPCSGGRLVTRLAGRRL
jgi:hypothetical protein